MKMRKSHVLVLVTLLLLLVCAFAVTAVAASDYTESSDGKTIIKYIGTGTTVSIPSKYQSIGADAFKGNTKITSVTMGSNITFIGAGAFEECTSLNSITISTAVDTIAARTFKNCAALSWVTIPRSVKTIGDEAFYGCVNMTKVEGPDPAYQGGLTVWPVSSYVTSVGTNAFGNCPKAEIVCFKGSALATYAIDNNLNRTIVDPIVYGIKATRSPFVIIWDASSPATVQLSVTVDPSTVPASELGYSISDSSVAKINETGLLTPVKPGATTLATVYALKNISVYTEIPIVVLDDRIGWQKIGGVWYYCKSRTEFAIGWNNIGGVWYYFNEAGQMQTGWLNEGGVWYYLYPAERWRPAG